MPGKNKSKSNSRKSVSSQDDIIELILEDHKPLKKLIKVMKNIDKPLAERRKAFEQFGPLLVKHAKPEEQILYACLKENKKLREEGFEGDVEHDLADQMLEETKRTRDLDQWGARTKVLAELVEHHIEEEEENLLPKCRRAFAKEERQQMGEDFRIAKENITSDGSEKDLQRKSPSPASLHAPSH